MMSCLAAPSTAKGTRARAVVAVEDTGRRRPSRVAATEWAAAVWEAAQCTRRAPMAATDAQTMRLVMALASRREAEPPHRLVLVVNTSRSVGTTIRSPLRATLA